jgi:pyruvate-formate lyase-activating enzyme
MTTLHEDMLEREQIANRKKHWVRLATACNSHCLFCLDADTPRNLFVPDDDVREELRRGRDELDADKVILSGGEATLHPRFHALVADAKAMGYERVQTVTNGWQLADRSFYEAAVRAGLGEITFSLHGHTEALHDTLTQTDGAFRRIVKGIARAVRDPRVIANVDIVINKQNVAVLDKIVELAIGLGVTEFDLLHVIPQAAAYEHRDQLFYDPREHIEVLHKVFRLNRHPGFVVWTNRFPIAWLEGLEDLVQDPHKMLDEINGRRFQLRRYLDEGVPLDCRQPERCVHCFIEPTCTTFDKVIRWVAEHGDALVSEGSEVEVGDPAQLPLALARAAHGEIDLVVPLTKQTAPALSGEAVAAALPHLRIHQPSYEHLAEAVACDVPDPAAFFDALALPVRVSGLPACQIGPGTRTEAPPRLPRGVFRDGRLDPVPLAREHVRNHYRAKSLRCRDCALDAACEGAHIQWLRAHGLAALRPLGAAEAARFASAPIDRLATGKPPEPVAPSLFGHPPPGRAGEDPLAALARAKANRRLRVITDASSR